jgi:hypothetical protein
MADTLQFLRGTSTRWTSTNHILKAGEPGIETDTNRFKIGDGFTSWNELEYYLTEDGISAMIQEAIADSGGGGSDGLALTAHINSATPHPVYDDGPSLALLYENAKV